MLRHKGKTRTYKHNLRIAALLSFIAGLVNITGVLAVKTLTTNITGHFAFFSEELTNFNFLAAFYFLLYILSFLFGAFFSNFLVEFFGSINDRYSLRIPIFIEAAILMGLGIFFNNLNLIPVFISCSLLFAMGMQNSMVTKISNYTVRTTHLTGLFTDLGIDLSQLFFYKKKEETQTIKKSIKLRFTIISFFFLGGLIGGFIYHSLYIKTLFIGCFCLILAGTYDIGRFYYIKLIRSIR